MMTTVRLVRHRQTKGAVNGYAKPTAQRNLFSTLPVILDYEELFTINRLGVTGELARCLATTNIIESPNSMVRRVSGRVTRYRDVQMALRWVAAGFLEAEKAFRKLRGHERIPSLIDALRQTAAQLKKVA